MRVVTGAGRFELAEGPLSWPDGTMTWVDVMAGTLHVARPDGAGIAGARAYRTAPPLSAAVRCAEGGYLLAAGHALRRMADDGTITAEAPVESGPARLNDGKCDAAGRFWVGSLSADPGRGGLFRVGADGVTRVLSGLTAANGLGWSPGSGTMYVTDTGERAVDAFDFDLATGGIERRRRLIEVSRGKPDGLCVDAEGCLWVAVWDGAAVHRYDPDGRLIRAYPAPVPRPTSCCLVDGTLWVTTAGSGLYTLDAGVTAPPAGMFTGVLGG